MSRLTDHVTSYLLRGLFEDIGVILFASPTAERSTWTMREVLDYLTKAGIVPADVSKQKRRIVFASGTTFEFYPSDEVERARRGRTTRLAGESFSVFES